MTTFLTSNYGWSMPDPGGSPNTWGDTLNQTTGKIDAASRTRTSSPACRLALELLWFGAQPRQPTGICCRGRRWTRSSPYDKLFAIFGTTYNVGTGPGADSFMLPNPQGGVFYLARVEMRSGQPAARSSYTNRRRQSTAAHTHPASQAAALVTLLLRRLTFMWRPSRRTITAIRATRIRSPTSRMLTSLRPMF